MFYMYFENRSGYQNAPLAIWMNGGPGCSGLYALFFENMGPYILDQQYLTLSENIAGWDLSLNIVFVDQVQIGSSRDRLLRR